MRRFFCIFIGLLTAFSAFADENDTLPNRLKMPFSRHLGYSLSVSPGKLIVMDTWQDKWQRKTKTTAFSAEINYTPLPQDSSDFARDYNYPTFALGLKFSLNDITMHRSPDPAWGMAQEVDYDSRLGNIATLYGTFSRPLYRSSRWMFDYMLGAGIGYGKHKYNNYDNIDNELTGSRFLIYFTAGLHATYRFADDWAVSGGIEFYHHSNGALNRPNKGANIFGPTLGLRYMPFWKELRSNGVKELSNEEFRSSEVQKFRSRAFQKRFYANFTLGVGGKTLNEEWQLTQFQTPPDSPDYRTSRFRFYMAYSAQADVMYRYARRWASGIGADFFYGTYADRVREIESTQNSTLSNEIDGTASNNPTSPHSGGLRGASTSPQSGGARGASPFSFGLALKHNAYYGNLSVHMSLGVYLYRQMGQNAKEVEQPYYERIGIHYTFPSLGGLTLGANVKAHRTKADLTEFVVSYPINL